MTSIVLAYNKNGISVSADSAGSLPSGKIFNSNKIFRITNEGSIGLATYGGSQIGGYPIELISKIFRKKASSKTQTLQETTDSFLKFIKDYKNIDVNIDELIFIYTYNIIQIIGNQKGLNIVEGIKETDKYFQNFVDEDNRMIPEELVDEIISYYNKVDLGGLLNNYESFKDEIGGLLKTSLEYYIPISISGLIFFGYGDNDDFPVVQGLEFYLKYKGEVYIKEVYRVADSNVAGVKPFAQKDGIDSYMYGISPTINNKLIDLTNSNEELIIALEGLRDDYYEKMTEVVKFLSIDELGEMTETLVSLQRFKTRMTSESESVSGPIDCAVVTKGEGLIRLNRKHYFDKELNLHYIKSKDDN